MADNNDDDLRWQMETQEQSFRAQQALDNIQQMLAQLLFNKTPRTLVAITMKRSTTTMNILRLKSQRKAPQSMSRYQRRIGSDYIPSPEGWTEESRDDTSLPVGMGLSSISTKVQVTYITHVWRQDSSNQHIYYFWLQTGNVIDNNAVMARLFIGTLKGVAFDWFRSLPNGSINS